MNLPIRRARLGILLALAVVAILALAWRLLVYDIRKDIDLRQFTDPDAGWSFYMPDASEATQTICGDPVPCIQAVDSSTVTVLRFETRAAAAAQSEAYGSSGALSGWIAVYFKPNGLNDRQRLEFMQGVDGINVSSE